MRSARIGRIGKSSNCEICFFFFSDTHSNNNISANMGGSQSAFRVPVELSSNHTVFANPITVDRNCIITDRNHMIPDPQRSPGSKSSPNYFVANLTSSPSSDSRKLLIC